jgi:hypothetical protein
MSLTDTEITDLCTRMEIPLGDICFKDELPDELEFNKGYFINLQDSVDQDGKPSPGTHWTFVECRKYPNDKIEAFYFDPYGVAPPENVKRIVKNTTKKQGLPYSTKDIQSLMNNACGYYCLAFAHFINASGYRSNNLYEDVETFLSLFEDLNKSTDFKKNEYILKMFFRSVDPKLRKEIEVITTDDTPGEIDGFKLPVDVKIMK